MRGSRRADRRDRAPRPRPRLRRDHGPPPLQAHLQAGRPARRRRRRPRQPAGGDGSTRAPRGRRRGRHARPALARRCGTRAAGETRRSRRRLGDRVAGARVAAPPRDAAAAGGRRGARAHARRRAAGDAAGAPRDAAQRQRAVRALVQVPPPGAPPGARPRTPSRCCRRRTGARPRCPTSRASCATCGAAPAQASKACRQLGLEAQKALQWLVHQPPPTATKVSVGAAAPGVAPGGGGGGGTTTMMQVRAGGGAAAHARAPRQAARAPRSRGARGGGGGDFRGALFRCCCGTTRSAATASRRRSMPTHSRAAPPVWRRLRAGVSAQLPVRPVLLGVCRRRRAVWVVRLLRRVRAAAGSAAARRCYEANPPFVPALVEAMARRRTRCSPPPTLAPRARLHRHRPRECGARSARAHRSPFLRRTLRAENRRHDYCEGA